MLPALASARGGGGGSAAGGSSLLPLYIRRIIHAPQMDLEFALYQMLWLCKSPKAVYKLTSHRKDTKNQWARDDPAFVAVLAWFLIVSSIAHAVCFGFTHLSSFLHVAVHALLQFLGSGCIVATAYWFLANKYLTVVSPHSVEREVEWLYAFDVHCNAYIPGFILLHVVQYLFLPLTLTGSFLGVLIGNSLYLVAAVAYIYVAFLGYLVLPFLHNTTRFLTPVVPVALLFLITVIFRVNIVAWALSISF